jgi:hypothetical protein
LTDCTLLHFAFCLYALGGYCTICQGRGVSKDGEGLYWSIVVRRPLWNPLVASFVINCMYYVIGAWFDGLIHGSQSVSLTKPAL